MRSWNANGPSRLHSWRRVREFAVPPSMIESATLRRLAGDWAGACAAARVDVDLDLRAARRDHGREVAARIRADLRSLAPDLLRWHLPRVAADGLLRPGLTISLARYDAGPTVHLVVRTPPAWAEAGQRVSLALWPGRVSGPHPHPHPDRHFRLDLHRHLWDAGRSAELAERSGRDSWPGPEQEPAGCAVHRWADEGRILLQAEGSAAGVVRVRLGGGRRLLLDPDGTAHPGDAPALPLLPYAATWLLPDLQLLRAGLIEPGRLHPLVAAALAPDHQPAAAPAPTGRSPRYVECRGSQHRIALVDGVLAPLDHAPDELRREELLTALGGVPLPCLRVIGEAARHPASLPDIRARLDHGDAAGALAAVEDLLGPAAVLRDGPLRDELAIAAERRIVHGLFRAGLTGPGPLPTKTPR